MTDHIHDLIRLHPEEVYGPPEPSHIPSGPITFHDILHAIAGETTACTDAGEIRGAVARCPELADLLLDNNTLIRDRDRRPLSRIIDHLCDLTGETPPSVYQTLRTDARTARALDELMSPDLSPHPPLTTRQGCATLVDVKVDEDTDMTETLKRWEEAHGHGTSD